MAFRRSSNTSFRPPHANNANFPLEFPAHVEDIEVLAVKSVGGLGAVAQLGERYNGIVEVRGSIPLSSTSFNKGLATKASSLLRITRCAG